MIRPMPSVLHSFCIALAAMFLIACGGAEDAGGDTNADAGTSAAWPETVRVGIVPTEGGADSRARFQPLRQHLGDRLGVEIEIVSASSYQAMITAMDNDQVEFCFFGPKSYVEAAKRAGAEALLIELGVDGSPGYFSEFIVPAGSEVQSIEDAQGLRFAYTDPNSTSGRLVPSIVLRDLTGMEADDFFGEVVFSGSHGSSALLVANGEIDIAATNNLDLGRMYEKGALRPDQIRVIHRSDLIPGAPWAARRDIPDDLKAAFVEAMLEMNDDAEMLARFANGGVREIEDSAYDIVRALSAQDAAEQEAAQAAPAESGS